MVGRDQGPWRADDGSVNRRPLADRSSREKRKRHDAGAAKAALETRLGSQEARRGFQAGLQPEACRAGRHRSWAAERRLRTHRAQRRPLGSAGEMARAASNNRLQKRLTTPCHCLAKRQS